MNIYWGRSLSLCGRRASRPRRPPRIGRGEVGLEVDERRAVETIEANDLEPVAIDPNQPHHAHGDRVGPGRRAQRKGAALDAVVPRHLQDDVAAGFVHPVEHDQVAAALHVLEGGRPAGIDLDRADRLGLAGVLRAILALLPGRVDAADIIERGVEALRQGVVTSPSQTPNAFSSCAMRGLYPFAPARQGPFGQPVRPGRGLYSPS